MNGYVPISNAIEVIKNWQEQGYEIIYLTSQTGRRAMKMAQHLDELGFVGSMVGYRQKYQDYTTLIKEELPDILVEDDCKSVGGQTNMCSYNLPDNIKNKIKIIKVKEFDGIDNVKLY